MLLHIDLIFHFHNNNLLFLQYDFQHFNELHVFSPGVEAESHHSLTGEVLKIMLKILKIITGFSKLLAQVHIIIHRLQDVFQQLSNGVFAS